MKSFKTKRGIRIKYQVIGTGKPFVFLHGLGGTHEQLLKFHEPLKKVQYVLMDQEGHGDSEADFDHLDFAVLGEDVIDLLNHLNIKKATFMGISMGAAVCLNIAVKHPERVKKLLLVRNAWVDEPIRKQIRDVYEQLADSLKHGDEAGFKASQAYSYLESFNSDYTLNAFLTPFKEEWNLKNYRKYRVIPKLVPVASAEAVQAIKKPVTIVACKGDLCHPFEIGKQLNDLIKDSIFYEIPNKDDDLAVHNIMLNMIIKEVLE